MVIINYHVPGKIVRCFATYEDGPLKLDFYPPVEKEQREDRACVITLHGGGFMKGSREDEWSWETARELCHKGFAVANVDYRLGLKDKKISLLRLGGLMEQSINMAVEDLAWAIIYLCGHAKEFDIDPRKIILAGCSAGAIVALQLGHYLANDASNWTIRILSELDFWPVAIAAYSGAVMCSPGMFRHENPIPTMLYHGLKDRIVRPGMIPCSLGKRFYGSVRLYEEFERHTGTFRMRIFPNAWHEVSMLLPRSTEEFCEFVEDALAQKDDHSLKVSLRTGIDSDEQMKSSIFGLLKK